MQAEADLDSVAREVPSIPTGVHALPSAPVPHAAIAAVGAAAAVAGAVAAAAPTAAIAYAPGAGSALPIPNARLGTVTALPCPPGTDPATSPYELEGTPAASATKEAAPVPETTRGVPEVAKWRARAAEAMGRTILVMGGAGTGTSGLLWLGIFTGRLEMRPIMVLPIFLCSLWLVIAYAIEAGQWRASGNAR